jgi:hypothetical protein
MLRNVGNDRHLVECRVHVFQDFVELTSNEFYIRPARGADTIIHPIGARAAPISSRSNLSLSHTEWLREYACLVY